MAARHTFQWNWIMNPDWIPSPESVREMAYSHIQLGDPKFEKWDAGNLYRIILVVGVNVFKKCLNLYLNKAAWINSIKHTKVAGEQANHHQKWIEKSGICHAPHWLSKGRDLENKVKSKKETKAQVNFKMYFIQSDQNTMQCPGWKVYVNVTS